MVILCEVDRGLYRDFVGARFVAAIYLSLAVKNIRDLLLCLIFVSAQVFQSLKVRVTSLQEECYYSVAFLLEICYNLVARNRGVMI